MSEVTVESLPEEVVLEVFKWLDTKSLKNVMLTCKQWEDYIRRSHQWTLNLTVASSLEDSEALLELVLKVNRKYNKVVLKGSNITDDGKILEIFEKHGESIHELTISWYHSTNASFWCKILNTMPNLKKIKMNSTSWEMSIDDLTDEEPLLKLKTLELDGKSTAVLKLFKKCQLHTLNVKTFKSFMNSVSSDGLWIFLATQQDLQELKLDSGSCSAMFEAPVTEESIAFRLKKLSVAAPPTNSNNNLMEFVKLHKNTLKDLELRSTFLGSFYEIVFSLNHLKTLSLEVNDIAQDSFERVGVNESVTSLQLNISGWATGFLRAAKTFYSRLPNVQKLVINGPSDSPFARYFAEDMKQVKSLDMSKVEAITFDGARFPALESLRIRRLNGQVNWFDFAKNNASITELWIGDIVKPIYLDVTGLTHHLKLSKLTIESSKLDCNEKFFEVIRKNCPELKSLELNEKSLKVDISTVADIPGLRFREF